MRLRDFLNAIGSTALLAKANAQQPRPVIGFLHQGALPLPSSKAAFRKGLIEVGISDGPDILIEDRAADGKYDQLPALAADWSIEAPVGSGREAPGSSLFLHKKLR